MNDPWSNVIERYPVGGACRARSSAWTDYGAFCRA